MTADTCPNACGRCHRCAEEITRLREDISRYVSRDTERLAEVEKLREALMPFAVFILNNPCDDRGDDELTFLSRGLELNRLTFGDFRRARAVLTGTEAPPAAESPSDATSTTKDT